MDTALIIIMAVTAASIAYCIFYWVRLYCKSKSESEIPGTNLELATYDAQLQLPEPIEPGFEFETPPPTYEEAIGVYEEPVASYGLRHRNSEDVRRDETGEECSPTAGESQSGEDSGQMGRTALNAEE